MPEDINELRKFENFSPLELLPHLETKILEILEGNKGEAFDLYELIEQIYGFNPYKDENLEKISKDLGKSVKDYFIKILPYFPLKQVLDEMIKKERIKQIVAKGKEFYYIE